MEKKIFDFYQDVKVTVWQRQHFTIEAETAEEARELAKQYADKDISTCDEVEADEIEWLYDTEEHITPEENGGCATIEVYEREGKYRGTLIADNAVSEYLSAKEEEHPLSDTKCRKFNKNEEVTVFDGRDWYQAIIEAELHTEDGEEEIPVFPIGDDGKCSLPPVYVKSSDVYPKAVGKFCPNCRRPLYVMHDKDIKYPYFCPECDESFDDIELQ